MQTIFVNRLVMGTYVPHYPYEGVIFTGVVRIELFACNPRNAQRFFYLETCFIELQEATL